MNVEFLNAAGARFLNFAVPVSLNGSLFWLVVATLAVLFRKKSATFLHALWLTALVAFLIPPQLPLPNPFSVSVPQVMSTIILAPVIATGPVAAATLSVQAVVGLFWLGIVGLLLAIFIGQSFRFFLLLRRAKPFDLTQKSDLALGTIGLWTPKIYLSPEIGMPLSTGTLLPKIFLPAEAESWPEHELDLVLKHEFAHIRRGDLLFMKFQALVQILFFFHPLVWITNSLINYYRELACDDATLSQSANQAVAYSKIILKTIDRARKFQYACLLSNCFGKNKSFLIRRFKHILKQKEEIMLKLTRFEKLVIASLVVLALAIACEQKNTQSVQEVEVPIATTASRDTAAIFLAYDTPPEPIGGFKAIQENLKYPESARNEKIEGRVFLKIAVNENGDVFKTELIKSLNANCDAAAIEAVRNSKWKPAQAGGKPVKVWISIPIIFSLTKKSIDVVNHPSDIDTTDPNFVKFDIAPEPIGGFQALQANLKYPEKERQAGIQGRVFVKIAIDENGKVLETEILKSLNENCDAAAIEAVQKTKWTPAHAGGKPVKVWISIPVIFKLK